MFQTTKTPEVQTKTWCSEQQRQRLKNQLPFHVCNGFQKQVGTQSNLYLEKQCDSTRLHQPQQACKQWGNCLREWGTSAPPVVEAPIGPDVSTLFNRRAKPFWLKVFGMGAVRANTAAQNTLKEVKIKIGLL
ncbi:hypothetical protein BY996DRAFT_6412081 [Phakopsora pachyrhizi]|nr:hypothetical protein BY996DRAFT_6412081 [Phakopsora pachyrhizi]